MDMKLVELQIALPKTYDAGKIQSDVHYYPQLAQSQLAEATKKQMERARRQVTEKRTSANVGREQNKQRVHPYKGKTIDIVG
ncbi:hypothetical protein [Parageobacillus thermoglucosidasius]|uniref:Transposase n=1 Tax=Parageobacillus thermoglucosidasius TaxID=1426 RepID=A0AB38R4J8_PARTM|nr:hypothetical protein [Parageobacillus thermoglucosidasius]KYD14775.1 hypothetical protein B4168_1984 [Anoxybacillus flavithermus]REK55066.1 MAG: hypothetical protein C6P36_13350 [Geobacillus sp.]AEH48561.1 hypothetical protein Geoth_2673 [Parageobacillus thermoglucosidasius C56-YS93]MBY6266964.1 hypothetical protein [Parageobacillus thermoglucosidasius]MED4904346.1 hypothetical protein [Parageobacillus thermoglucosidasius]